VEGGLQPARGFSLAPQRDSSPARTNKVRPPKSPWRAKIFNLSNTRSVSMARFVQFKSILFGLLAMVLGMIALAIVLLIILVRIEPRQIAIGPVYLLVPIASFVAGYYWSLRRSSRPKPPAKLPSKVTIVAKSVAVGIIAMVASMIADIVWIRLHITRPPHGAAVAIDVYRVVRLPVLVAGFLVGFLLEYWRVSRRVRGVPQA
jgi:hypothetical protein